MTEGDGVEPLCVLVVDDCLDTTDSLALLVRAWGYRVRVANDGPAALRLAAADPPDAVFLDVGMPRMTGWEVARCLRKMTGLEGTLLVAVSGYGLADDQRRSLEAGCNLHLIKPVAPETIRGLLAARDKEIRDHVPRELDLHAHWPGDGS